MNLFNIFAIVCLLFQATKAVNLYGLNFAVVNNALILQTVSISDSGEFTALTNNTVYAEGDSMVTDGVSTFDKKNKIFYYAVDADDNYLHSVDVANHLILASVDFGVTSIESISYDEVEEAVWMIANYSYENVLLLKYEPSTFTWTPSFNFSEYKMDKYFIPGAVDSKTSMFYFTYLNVSNNDPTDFWVGRFSTADPSGTLKITAISSPSPFVYISYIQYDDESIVSIGEDSYANSLYVQIEVDTGKAVVWPAPLCSHAELQSPIAITYSQEDKSFYGVCVDNTIGIFNVNTYKNSTIQLPNTANMADIEAA